MEALMSAAPVTRAAAAAIAAIVIQFVMVTAYARPAARLAPRHLPSPSRGRRPRSPPPARSPARTRGPWPGLAEAVGDEFDDDLGALLAASLGHGHRHDASRARARQAMDAGRRDAAPDPAAADRARRAGQEHPGR